MATKKSKQQTKLNYSSLREEGIEVFDPEEQLRDECIDELQLQGYPIELIEEMLIY